MIQPLTVFCYDVMQAIQHFLVRIIHGSAFAFCDLKQIVSPLRIYNRHRTSWCRGFGYYCGQHNCLSKEAKETDKQAATHGCTAVATALLWVERPDRS